VVVFPETMLTSATIQKLHDLGCRYDEWLKVSMENQNNLNKIYGEKFYYSAEKEG
jgi:hypothetical protein